MAERKVFDCDRCSAKGGADWHITVEFGWEPDPAGGHGSPRRETFDLCPTCRNRVNRRIMDLLSEEQRRELLMFLVVGTRRERAWSTATQAEVKLWEL